MVNPDILSDYPTLKRLKNDVFAIPQIQKFLESTVHKTSMVGG